MHIVTKHGTELQDSFGTEDDAHWFAHLFTKRTGLTKTHVSPLLVNGEPTSWFRLAVPAKGIQRAEDMRYALQQASQAAFEAQDAARYDHATGAAADELVAQTRRYIAEHGLSDACRTFLAAAQTPAGASPWLVGAGSVAKCKRMGWVEAKVERGVRSYITTKEGDEVLRTAG